MQRIGSHPFIHLPAAGAAPVAVVIAECAFVGNFVIPSLGWPPTIGESLLLKQINAGKVEAENVTAAVRLVVRESCGAAQRKSREEVA